MGKYILLLIALLVALVSCEDIKNITPVNKLKGKVIVDFRPNEDYNNDYNNVWIKNETTGKADYYRVLKIDSENWKKKDTIK